MICISINKKDVNSVLRAIKKLEFAEIRLDVLNPSINDIRKIFSSHKNLIATMRPCNVTNDKRTDILIQAVRSGARYVDIEMELPSELRKKIIFSARKNNCKIIISYHNFDKTPDSGKLNSIVKKCFRSGADIVKIACMVNDIKDNSRILALIDNKKPMIAIGMGKLGKITRISAIAMGAFLTFASISDKERSADGQIRYLKLKKILREIKFV